MTRGRKDGSAPSVNHTLGRPPLLVIVFVL
jgi:hypothetical protein